MLTGADFPHATLKFIATKSKTSKHLKSPIAHSPPLATQAYYEAIGIQPHPLRVVDLTKSKHLAQTRLKSFSVDELSMPEFEAEKPPSCPAELTIPFDNGLDRSLIVDTPLARS